MNDNNKLTPSRRRELLLGMDDADFEVAQADVCLIDGAVEEAKLRLEFAARRGHAEAQYKLGSVCYDEGAFRTAAKWWRLAAWQRLHPGAQRRLAGLCYERGDHGSAIKHLRDSADGGDTDAQQALACLLATGDGVPVDPVAAYGWLAIAAERGALRPEMDQQFKPTDVAEAKRFITRAKKQIAQRQRRSKRLSRTRRPRRGIRHYVGSQEMMGSFEEWEVRYAVRRHGDYDWIVYLASPGGKETHGPTTPGGLITVLEEHGMDVDHFVADLRARRQASLHILAREVEHLQQLLHEPAPPAPVATPAPLEHRDLRTYTDDGDLRIYRHRPEPRRAFEAVLNVGDRANGLTIGTADGQHEADIELRAHTDGEMKPVVRLRGQIGSDGRLEVVVTNVLTGAQQVIGL